MAYKGTVLQQTTGKEDPLELDSLLELLSGYVEVE